MQNAEYFNEFLIIILILIAIGIIYYYVKRFRKPSTKRSNYLAALEYLSDGDDKRAIQQFKEAVRDNTENVDAYLRLGNLLRDRGFVSNALKIHKDLLLRTGIASDFQQKVEKSLMLDYEELGEFKSAAETARKILENDSVYSKQVANKLLKYLEKNKEWNQSYDAVKKYFKPITPHLEKKMALYRVFEGIDLFNEDNGKEARIKFKEALKVDSHCTPAYFYLGKSYYLEDRIEEAVAQWKALCNTIPQNAYVVFEPLERAWFELGKFTEAEKLYSDILSKDPDNIEAALSLSKIYNKKAEYDNALTTLDDVIKNHPEDLRILALRIQNFHDKGQYKSASSEMVNYFRQYSYISGKKFICQECHYKTEEPHWICPQCENINTFNI